MSTGGNPPARVDHDASARASSAPRPSLVFDCPVGLGSSDELTALHLTLALHSNPSLRVVPILGVDPSVAQLSEKELAVMRAYFTDGAADRVALLETDAAKPLPATLVRALGRGLAMLPTPASRRYAHSVGFASVSDTEIDDAMCRRGQQTDVLLAGSPWQQRLLRSAGLDNGVFFAPGVDTLRFKPMPRRELRPGRFVILSAGRLDFRKGQDLVVAAFNAFRSRHPEALLLCAWQNHWPEGLGNFDGAGHVQGLPEYLGGFLDITGWLLNNGIPLDAMMQVGSPASLQLATYMAGVDVALFPSRAESSPNGAMLECLAAGVPTIVSRNTGNTEYARADIAFPLESMTAVRGTPAGVRGTDGWGEPSVEEIVEQLEAVYADRNAARRRAVAASREVAKLAWSERAREFASLLAPLFAGAGLS